MRLVVCHKKIRSVQKTHLTSTEKPFQCLFFSMMYHLNHTLRRKMLVDVLSSLVCRVRESEMTSIGSRNHTSPDFLTFPDTTQRDESKNQHRANHLEVSQQKNICYVSITDEDDKKSSLVDPTTAKKPWLGLASPLIFLIFKLLSVPIVDFSPMAFLLLYVLFTRKNGSKAGNFFLDLIFCNFLVRKLFR